MTKTGSTLAVALFVVTVSLGLAATRRAILGPDIEGPLGSGEWRVTLVATGDLKPDARSVALALVPDFRRQHITQERFRSTELIAHVGRRNQAKQQGKQRTVTWRRASVVAGKPQPFRLTYSFRCLLGMRWPTPAMEALTAELDAKPDDRTFLQSGPLIESDDPAIADRAARLTGDLDTDEARVKALYDFVNRFDTEVGTDNQQGARACLDHGAGDSGGKARLLVALCRSQNLSARLLSGLVLGHEKELTSERERTEAPLHFWAEAWVGGHWMPLDPSEHHFGADKFPETYVVLATRDAGFGAGGREALRYAFFYQRLPAARFSQDATPSPLKSFFLRISLYRLEKSERNLVRFLLLLPLAALVVSIFRTLIGVPTFGTFAPALLGLAFTNPQAMKWGLPIFLLIVLLGWAMRHGLERFHLLQVPRAAALLTLIVGLLIVLIVVSSILGVTTTQYVGLFPLVILTHLVERFWTVEAEDGTASSFRTLVGTFVVSVTVSLTLMAEAIGTWMIRYPETLGVILAVQLMLGRYTGYRLAELYRFGDLVHDEATDKPPAAKESDSPNGQAEDGSLQAARSEGGARC
jgi:transglutaminase-like putative cysteine protease